jgi:hypothetical protein
LDDRDEVEVEEEEVGAGRTGRSSSSMNEEEAFRCTAGGANWCNKGYSDLENIPTKRNVQRD